MAVVAELGGLDWFILGDRDIGLHLVRSERLRAGEPLSAVTADFARRYGLGARLLPASDDRLRTRIVTPDGELAFQEWLVGPASGRSGTRRALRGRARAHGPRRACSTAIESADVIVLAPSNPFVSLDPILAVDGLREAVAARRERVVAVTPMIGAKAVKGPLAGMLETLGHEVGAVGVARVLAPLAGGFVLDEADREPRARRARAGAERGLRADSHARRRELCGGGARRARPEMSDLAVFGLRGLPELRAGDDLAGLLLAACERSAGGLRDGDVVCVAQKAVSKVEGRSVELASRRAVRARAGDRRPTRPIRAWSS